MEKLINTPKTIEVKELLSMIDNKRVAFNEDRNFVEEGQDTEVEFSKIIENLILGLPVPLVIFYENEHGQYEIISGKKVIQAIFAFNQKELILLNVSHLPVLDGKHFDEMNFSQCRDFYESKILIIEYCSQVQDSDLTSIKNTIQTEADYWFD